MAYPWIKLYTEIIHDPKLARLPEHVQLVFVKLLCVTGEHDPERSGALPPLDDIAWTLRLDDTQLADDMSVLESVGVVRCVEGVWYVTNFSTRQAAQPVAERVAAHRERQQKAEYEAMMGVTPGPQADAQSCNEPVTSRYTDKTRLDKTRLEVDVDQSARVTPAVAPRNDDDLTAYFFRKLENANGVFSSQAQADLYREMVVDIAALPVEYQRPFVDSLFEECARTTVGRVTPAWYRKVIDGALREGRLPGQRAPASVDPPRPRLRLVTEHWRNPMTGEMEELRTALPEAHRGNG